MTAVKIPIDRLGPDTLQGVIEEFVSRDGTDYGEHEVAVATKVRQVQRQLESGAAVLVYDDETGTCTVLAADDPAVRFLDG